MLCAGHYTHLPNMAKNGTVLSIGSDDALDEDELARVIHPGNR